jgi:protein TonB
MTIPIPTPHKTEHWRRALPWVLSIGLCVMSLWVMDKFQQVQSPEEQEVLVRKVDIALPPPPPPPPPVRMETPELSNDAPSINLSGAGAGPPMQFSEKPTLSHIQIDHVEQPKFDMHSMDLSRTLAVDFPVIEVKQLDEIPRVISYKFIRFPSNLRRQGVTRVSTKVELIIDQKGRPYIKKIVDPVYPEMDPVIRNWVKGARFSVPLKNGLPVQALYFYTLHFNNQS